MERRTTLREIDVCVWTCTVLPLLLALVASTPLSCHADSARLKKAEEVVATFVLREFRGEVDVRLGSAFFSEGSPETIEEKQHPDWLYGRVISLVGGPIVVVERYSLGTPVEGEKLAVPVTFDLVAISEGETPLERRIVLPSHRSETVVFHVAERTDGWKIVDPPAPRVSVVALSKELAGEAAGMVEVLKYPKASDAQRRIYDAFLRQKEELDRIVNARK